MAMQTAAEAEAVVLPLVSDDMMPEKTKDHVIRRISKMSGVLSKADITIIDKVAEIGKFVLTTTFKKEIQAKL